MRVLTIFLLYFSGLLFLSGCLPKGCDDSLEIMKVKMDKAELAINKVQLQSDLKLRPGFIDLSTIEPEKQTRTPLCTELPRMGKTAEDKEVALFVNGKATKDGSGESWDDAMKSIGAAVKKAIDIRQLLIEQAGPNHDKPIYILVAGGTYSLSHEKSVLGAKSVGDNSSLLIFEGHSPYYHENIKILGGYLPDDGCLQLPKNDPDYKNNVARITVLDGEGTSNSVININAKAHRIEISDFTVKGGNAAENKPDEHKLFGGAMIIHGGANDITLKNLKLEDSESADKGGCLAIYGTDAAQDTPHNITFSNVTLSGCKAVNGGGGVYIGGDAHTIKTENGTFNANNSRATDPASNGGGLLIEDHAGVQGEIKIAGSISGNGAGQFGGGVAIMGDAQQIVFNAITIDRNKVREVNSKGGGVYIAGQVEKISLEQGSVSNNEANLAGGGVIVEGTAVTVLVPAAVAMPPERFRFVSLNIVGNELKGLTGDQKGAGVMLTESSDITIRGGTIADNKGAARGVGLAIFGKINHVLIEDVDIFGNAPQAGPLKGSGVYVDRNVARKPGRIAFSRNKIRNHEGPVDGAGLFASHVEGLELQGMIFNNNHSTTQNGGGAYLYECLVRKHENNSYVSNTAKISGGGLWVERSTRTDPTKAAFFMKNITCTNNGAITNGGCAYIAFAPGTSIEGGNYVGNGKGLLAKGITVTERGGALYYLSKSADDIGFPGVPDDENAALEIKPLDGAGSVFEQNHASMEGGAIYTAHVFSLKISNASFTRNGALLEGGAIFADSSHYGNAFKADFKAGALVEMNNDTKFEKNAATGDGGAVHFINLRSLSTSAGDITFSENRSLGHGGAIFAGFVRKPGDVSRLWLSSSTTFHENHAEHAGKEGGAVYVNPVPNTVSLSAKFTKNTANAGGGGISFDGPASLQYMETHSSSFIENETTTGNGGGLLVKVNISEHRDLFGRYEGNKAPAGKGGGAAFMGNLLFVAPFSTERAVFDGNQATENLALHFATPPSKYFFKNTIFANHRRVGGCGSVMTLGVIESLEIDNRAFRLLAPEDRPEEIYNNQADEGGAFCVQKITGNLTLREASFKENKATVGGGGLIKIINGQKTLSVDFINASFHHNTAKGDGGVMDLPEANILRTQGGWFMSNQAGGSGGALAIHAATDLDLSWTSWSINEAKSDGGAIAMGKVENLNIAGASFEGNIAEGDGGAVAIDKVVNQVRINNQKMRSVWSTLILRLLDPDDKPFPGISRFQNNRARGVNGGGAFYFASVGSLNLMGQAWLGNSADKGAGGAFYVGKVLNGNVSIDSALLYNNKARTNGGALYVADLNNHDFSIGHGDRAFEPDGELITYFRAPSARLVSMDDVIPAGEVLSTANWDSINELGKSGRVTDPRIFLVEKNTAETANGGAFWIANAGNIGISRMSFGANKAPAGIGGTIYASLNSQANVEDSVIYGGEAQQNAGGIYLQAIGLNAEVRIARSGIQSSKVAQASADCAGGVFVENFKGMQIHAVGFYDNEARSQNIANVCAGALRFKQSAPIHGGNATFTATYKDRLSFEGNKVLGAFAPGSLGTALIPPNIWNTISAVSLNPGPVLNNAPQPTTGYKLSVFAPAP